MLDLIISLADGILNNPFADWGWAPTNYETGEDGAWINSSFDLNFGSRTQWTLVGRETAVNYGRKLEYKVDIEQPLLRTMPKLDNFFGNGFQTFTYGSETSLSYGSSNWSLSRKIAADQEFEIVDDKETHFVNITNGLFILVSLTIAVLYRANMLTGFIASKNRESVEKWNKLLTTVSNEIQPVHMFAIVKYEKASYAKNAVDKAAAELETILDELTAKTAVATQEVTNRVSAILNTLDTKQKADVKITVFANQINKHVSDSIQIISDVTQQVGAIIDVFQSNRKNWYDTNKKYMLHCDSYTVDAAGNKSQVVNPGTLTLQATKYKDKVGYEIDKRTKFAMTSNSISMESGASDDDFEFTATKDTGLNIKSPHIELQTHDNSNKVCSISLDNKTTSINILSGTSATGPSIKIDGKEDKLTLSVGTDQLGNSVIIEEEKIEIGNIGAILKVAKKPLISIGNDQITLSSGVCQINLDQTKITLKAGSNEIELDLIKLKESVVNYEGKSKLLTSLESTITEHKNEIGKQSTAIEELKKSILLLQSGRP